MIEVKGPNVFAGYWNMPEKTAAEFKPETGLKRIVITGADFDVGEYIVCRAERQRLPLVRSFFEMVQDVIEAR